VYIRIRITTRIAPCGPETVLQQGHNRDEKLRMYDEKILGIPFSLLTGSGLGNLDFIQSRLQW